MLSAKNVVKPGYSVFIRQTTSAGVVWLLTTLSHSLYIESDNSISSTDRRERFKCNFLVSLSGVGIRNQIISASAMHWNKWYKQSNLIQNNYIILKYTGRYLLETLIDTATSLDTKTEDVTVCW